MIAGPLIDGNPATVNKDSDHSLVSMTMPYDGQRHMGRECWVIEGSKTHGPNAWQRRTKINDKHLPSGVGNGLCHSVCSLVVRVRFMYAIAPENETG